MKCRIVASMAICLTTFASIIGLRAFHSLWKIFKVIRLSMLTISIHHDKRNLRDITSSIFQNNFLRYVLWNVPRLIVSFLNSSILVRVHIRRFAHLQYNRRLNSLKFILPFFAYCITKQKLFFWSPEYWFDIIDYRWLFYACEIRAKVLVYSKIVNAIIELQYDNS